MSTRRVQTSTKAPIQRQSPLWTWLYSCAPRSLLSDVISCCFLLCCLQCPSASFNHLLIPLDSSILPLAPTFFTSAKEVMFLVAYVCGQNDKILWTDFHDFFILLQVGSGQRNTPLSLVIIQIMILIQEFFWKLLHYCRWGCGRICCCCGTRRFRSHKNWRPSRNRSLKSDRSKNCSWRSGRSWSWRSGSSWSSNKQRGREGGLHNSQVMLAPESLASTLCPCCRFPHSFWMSDREGVQLAERSLVCRQNPPISVISPAGNLIRGVQVVQCFL